MVHKVSPTDIIMWAIVLTISQPRHGDLRGVGHVQHQEEGLPGPAPHGGHQEEHQEEENIQEADIRTILLTNL